MKKESPANSSGNVAEGFEKESIKKTQEDEQTPNKSCRVDLLAADIPKRKRGYCGSIDLDIYKAARILTEMKRSSSSCAVKQEKQEEEIDKQTEKNRKPSSECGNNGEDVEDDDDDDEGKKKKHKGKKTDHPQAPPTEILNFIKNELGGSQCDPVLVITKKITKTDANSKNARFSMPQSEVTLSSRLLTEEEKKVLSVKNKKVDVTLIILPRLDKIPMKLTWWEMGKYKSYMLNGSWSKVTTGEVMEKNGLKEGVMVQVWGFRKIRGELFLALARVQEGEDNNGVGHYHRGNVK